MAATKNHDYHLVDPDPWPLIGSISALALFGGLASSCARTTPAIEHSSVSARAP
jgi:hypothetical protein